MLSLISVVILIWCSETVEARKQKPWSLVAMTKDNYWKGMLGLILFFIFNFLKFFMFMLFSLHQGIHWKNLITGDLAIIRHILYSYTSYGLAEKIDIKTFASGINQNNEVWSAVVIIRVFLISILSKKN